MEATAIVPIKRFGGAKSRLAGTAADGLRPKLARAMLEDVLEELGRSTQLERIVVVSGEPAARDLAVRCDADHLDDPEDIGHSEAARIGIADAISRGAGCVALLPGDCPLVAASEIDSALASMTQGVAVIPDRHGSGTNGLILSPPSALEPSFGPGSRGRHLELAQAAGVSGRVVEIPSLALDLDTEDDLIALARLLGESPARAPATAAALASLAGTRS